MAKLATKELCTGCTACMVSCPRSCISMEKDEYGFFYPAVDQEKCIECGLCENRCPIIKPSQLGESAPQAYAAYSKDDHIRINSSSGGIFSEIAKAVLHNGGIVFGAAYNDAFGVEHICIDRENDLIKLCGAKYSQSNMGVTFRNVKAYLEGGKMVLFSGTPCQVAGLSKFLNKTYDNLIKLDFVCHSVPSPMVWEKYVKYRADVDNNGIMPVNINLRSKKTGWSNYKYSNMFEYSNGASHVEKSRESLYMKLFVGGYISRESCDNCQFKGYHRISDITIGDFWGIWDIAPEMNDNRGTSVVLVQTKKGVELWERINSRLIIKPVELEETSCQNMAILKSSQSNKRRNEILGKIKDEGIAVTEDLFVFQKSNIVKKIGRKILNILK